MQVPFVFEKNMKSPSLYPATDYSGIILVAPQTLFALCTGLTFPKMDSKYVGPIQKRGRV